MKKTNLVKHDDNNCLMKFNSTSSECINFEKNENEKVISTKIILSDHYSAISFYHSNFLNFVVGDFQEKAWNDPCEKI